MFYVYCVNLLYNMTNTFFYLTGCVFMFSCVTWLDGCVICILYKLFLCDSTRQYTFLMIYLSNVLVKVELLP